MGSSHEMTDWINELRYHQLLNLASGLANSLSTMVEALTVGTLQISDDNIRNLIPAMKSSTEQMRQLALVLLNLTERDDHYPCSLRDAINHAMTFFTHSLVRRRIQVTVSADDGMMVAVPFDIAVFALANIIGNAKDSIGEGGRILIEAEATGETIACQITDDGKGVLPELRATLFDENTTTKPGGRGKGLFLTRTTLGHSGATIELTSTGEDGSVFTIIFPTQAAGGGPAPRC